MQDRESCVERRAGSNPVLGTMLGRKRMDKLSSVTRRGVMGSNPIASTKGFL